MRKTAYIFALLLCLWSGMGLLPVSAAVPSSPEAESTEQPAAGTQKWYTVKPKAVLESYEVVEGNLTAGSTITLRFHFRNSSRSHPIEDLAVELDRNNIMVYPAFGSSSQLYVGDIPRNGSVTVEGRYTIGTAPSNPLRILLNTDYVVPTYGQVDGLTAIYLPLVASGGFDPQLSVPKTAHVGQPCNVNGIVNNTVGGNLFDIVMAVEGDIEDSGEVIHLGDLEHGEQLIVSHPVTFRAAALSAELRISFQFQDAYGNSMGTEAMVYPVRVTELPGASSLSPNQWAGWRHLLSLIPLSAVLAACAAGMAVLAAATMIQRRKKRHRF